MTESSKALKAQSNKTITQRILDAASVLSVARCQIEFTIDHD